MGFRGPKAHPNGQWISGKLRRKFMSGPGLRRIHGLPHLCRTRSPNGLRGSV